MLYSLGRWPWFGTGPSKTQQNGSKNWCNFPIPAIVFGILGTGDAIMQSPYDRQRVENWVGDFCSSDAIREFVTGVREYASDVLVKFIIAACEIRKVEPGDLEEADLKAALLGPIAKLNIPPSIKSQVPALCGALLGHMEAEGRLSGGRLLGAYVRALGDAFEDSASGKPKPIVRPGSRLKRNDPCPCGSGKKYKKCCMDD